MKSRTLTLIAATTVFAALVIPLRLAAQERAGDEHHAKHHRYKLIEIGTFGGPSSNFNNFYDGPFFDSGKVLSKRGTFAGWADTPAPDPFPSFCFNLHDCSVSHAVRWHDGRLTDLGTLADGWGSDATWINDTGDIVGISQNGVIDPLTGFPEQRAVFWRNGQITDLGTLGGNQSAAFAVNNHGQVAGLALNTTPDPFSIYDYFLFGSPTGTQTRAVLWDKDGGMQDLGTLGGPDAYALLVNEHGEVTGWSFTDSIPNATTGLPTFHPFLWKKGTGMQDLGTLGGTVAQAVNGLNERGEVIGATTLAGDMTHHPFLWDGKKLIDLGTLGGDNGEAIWVNNAGEVIGGADYTAQCRPGVGGEHAFLWRDGAMTDLGTVNGIPYSEADFINDRTQIVGNSFNCDFSAVDAFLWEKGSIVDLNTLISPATPIHLTVASYIDNRGEIAAVGNLPNGDQHAVLLIPCDENHVGVEGCECSLLDGSATTSVAGSAPAPRDKAHIQTRAGRRY
jgi:probable HAF family extracellular repeat protein